MDGEQEKIATPATIEELRDWALIVKIENDIESYTDGQMSLALGVLELIADLEGMYELQAINGGM